MAEDQRHWPSALLVWPLAHGGLQSDTHSERARCTPSISLRTEGSHRQFVDSAPIFGQITPEP